MVKEKRLLVQCRQTFVDIAHIGIDYIRSRALASLDKHARDFVAEELFQEVSKKRSLDEEGRAKLRIDCDKLKTDPADSSVDPELRKLFADTHKEIVDFNTKRIDTRFGDKDSTSKPLQKAQDAGVEPPGVRRRTVDPNTLAPDVAKSLDRLNSEKLDSKVRNMYEEKLVNGSLSPSDFERLMNLRALDRGDLEALLLKKTISDKGLSKVLQLEPEVIGKLLTTPESNTLLKGVERGLIGNEAGNICDMPKVQQKIATEFLNKALNDPTGSLTKESVGRFLQLTDGDRARVLQSMNAQKTGLSRLSTADVHVALTAPIRAVGDVTIHDTGALIDGMQRGVLNRSQVAEFSRLPADARAGAAALLKGNLLTGESTSQVLKLAATGELSPKHMNDLAMAEHLQWVAPESLSKLLKQDPIVREAILERISSEMKTAKRGSTPVDKLIERIQPLTEYMNRGVINEPTFRLLSQSHPSDVLINDLIKSQAGKPPGERIQPQTLQQFVEMCRNGDIEPTSAAAYRRAMDAGTVNDKSLRELLNQAHASRKACEQVLQQDPKTFADLLQKGDLQKLVDIGNSLPDAAHNVFPEMFPESGKFRDTNRSGGSDTSEAGREISKFMELMDQGDYAAALHFWNDKLVTPDQKQDTSHLPEVQWTKNPNPIALADLNDPAKLQQLLKFMNGQGKAQDNVMRDHSVQKVIKAPDPMIALPDGKVFSLRSSSEILENGGWRKTTPEEKALIDSIQRSPSGKAILGKTAMIVMEEWGHCQQGKTGGISPLTEDFSKSPQYKDLRSFWKDRVPPDQLDITVNEAMREIDIAAALIDAGMSPKAVKQILGDQHLAGERQYFYDFLEKRSRNK